MKRLLLLLVLCAGCDIKMTHTSSEQEYYDRTAAEVVYTKDLRTGICYAMNGSTDGFAMTCVPCDSLKRIKTIAK